LYPHAETLEQPEWYFSHILNVIHDQRAFMETTIQTLLGLTSHNNINAYREFISLLFPILARKIKRSMSQLLRDPRLLAQTIYQALAFDSQLIEDGFSLVGTSTSQNGGEHTNWGGISDVMLGNKEWFDAWLEAERQCKYAHIIQPSTNSFLAVAEEQYNEIIHAQDAWHVSDDGGFDERHRDLRPTNSARRIKALFDQVSDRYRAVPHFHHRARFLIAIQIPILEQYHSRISGSLDAFEALSSTLMRAVPGALAGQAGHPSDRKRLIDGVEGLQRLLKAFVSARWITMAMQSWGEMLVRDPHLGLREGRSFLTPCSSISSYGTKLTREQLSE
jgi:RAD50-interacting protein 1